MTDFSKRARMATRIVIVLFLILGFSSCADKTSSSVQDKLAPFVSVKAFFEEEVPSYCAKEKNNPLPEAFEKEVLAPSNTDEVWVSEGEGVMFFLKPADAASVFVETSNELIANGWSSIESGYGFSASFVKETGVYTWAFVTCIDYGTESALMIHVS